MSPGHGHLLTQQLSLNRLAMAAAVVNTYADDFPGASAVVRGARVRRSRPLENQSWNHTRRRPHFCLVHTAVMRPFAGGTHAASSSAICRRIAVLRQSVRHGILRETGPP